MNLCSIARAKSKMPITVKKPEHQSQVSDRMYMVKQPKQEKSKMQPLE